MEVTSSHTGHDHHADQHPERRAEVLRDASKLEYFSLAWNVVETVVGMVAGVMAGSVALIGFALDSVVESSSASVLIWRIRAERHGHRTSEEAERKAVRFVAVAFYALALYVGAARSGIWFEAKSPRRASLASRSPSCR